MPLASVEGVHDSWTTRSEMPVADRPVGTVGTVASVGGLVTMTSSQVNRLIVLVDAETWTSLTRMSVMFPGTLVNVSLKGA